jgi:ubiquinone/menaquinone biosynthesis C-methylase UbiE
MSTDLTTAYRSAAYAKVNRLDPHHLRRVEEALPRLVGKEVLEVGCGRGHLLHLLQEAGAHAVGIDANDHAVEQGEALEMAVGDATNLPFPDERFDAVVSVHTIEHLTGLDSALAEMARVVRRGGLLLLIYPAEPIRGLWAIPTAVILHRNPLKARQVHRQKLTPERLRARMAHLPVVHRHSSFSWRGWPQYTSVFDRRG